MGLTGTIIPLTETVSAPAVNPAHAMLEQETASRASPWFKVATTEIPAHLIPATQVQDVLTRQYQIVAWTTQTALLTIMIVKGTL